MKNIKKTDWKQAPVLQILFAVAGFFVFSSIILGFFVHPNFFYFAAFVGMMQMIFAATGWCPMAIGLQLCGKECTLVCKK